MPRPEGMSVGADAVGLGILFILANTVLVTVQDAAIKLLLTTVPLFQLMFLRSVTATAISLELVRKRKGWAALRPVSPRLMALRSVLQFMSWALYMAALARLPIATAIVLFFTSPLMALPLGVLVARERIGWRRGAAVAMGFVGVAIIADPRADGLDAGMLLGLAAAASRAGMVVLTRSMRHQDSPEVILSWVSVTFLIGSALPLPFVWQPVDWPTVLALLAIGVLGMLCQLTGLAAYRAAPIPIVSSFEYVAVVWAMVAGYLLWNDAVTPPMLLGSALIAAGGILTMYGEGALRSRFGARG